MAKLAGAALEKALAGNKIGASICAGGEIEANRMLMPKTRKKARENRVLDPVFLGHGIGLFECPRKP